MHIIAADVGGTKTRIIFANLNEPGTVLYEARYSSGEFDAFEPLLEAFIHDSGSARSKVEVVSLAFPGLVSEASAQLTNLPWTIEKQALKDRFCLRDVYFMNDFQAAAVGTGQLAEDDKIILNKGLLKNDATRVAVGAGTGLGLAWIQNDHNEEHAYSTEGGHIDFAPVDDSQIKLLQFLLQRHEHVSYERLLSGSGLVALYEFCSGRKCRDISGAWVNNHSATDEAADRALTLFVQIYGAYIGNIALLFKPQGGIFITGGIAAQMIQRMQSEAFIHAYLSKGRMRTLVEQIAVYLVTNDRVGVLGAMSQAVKMQKGVK